MKITIELSERASMWLISRVLELGPLTRMETIAAAVLEREAERAIQQRQLERQAQQDEQGEQ